MANQNRIATKLIVYDKKSKRFRTRLISFTDYAQFKKLTKKNNDVLLLIKTFNEEDFDLIKMKCVICDYKNSELKQILNDNPELEMRIEF